jgi:hypothetical protein
VVLRGDAQLYAGLGLMKRASGGKSYPEKLRSDYNHLLKYNIKQVAEAATRAENNPFRCKYPYITLLHGMASNRARLTIARDMLATM